MPGRAVHSRSVTGVNVLARSPAPALATGDELKFHDALAAQTDGYNGIEPLRGRRHDDPNGRLECGLHFRPAHDLREMRRTDLLFPFGDQHEVHWQPPARAANGV